MSDSATIILVDLSSVAHPIYAMAAADADPNAASQQIVARIRALATGADHVAVCCDAGRSFRKELVESYKANRPERDEALYHQIRLACEQLQAEGFVVWAVKGFEADDLIASATYRALEDAERATRVVIASADKDLLQLVTEDGRVVAKSLRDGSTVDHAAVVTKFGVTPAQMRDYLTLVGDSSDNIKGVQGVGPKRAAELLAKFGTLDELYRDLNGADALKVKALGLTPAIAKALLDFAPLLDETRTLIALRTDVEIPFADIFQPRVIADAETFTPDMDTTPTEAAATPAPAPAAETPAPTPAPAAGAPEPTPAATPEPTPPARPVLVQGNQPKPAPGHDMAMTPSTGQSQALAPHTHGASFTHQLEPRTLQEAGQLAKWIFESRQFSAYGSPQAVLATILAGRELGLQAMASLRAIHIVDGKPTLAADLIRAKVLQSGLARTFRCVERVDERGKERATFITQRGDDPPISLTFTVEDGRAMWAKSDEAWAKSGWGRNAADMCVARASVKLARLVYPEVTFGLYTRDEIEDGRVA